MRTLLQHKKVLSWIFMIVSVDQSHGDSGQRWAHSSRTRHDCLYKTASDRHRRLPLISPHAVLNRDRWYVNQSAKATPYFVTFNGYPPRRILKTARVVEVLSIKAPQKVLFIRAHRINIHTCDLKRDVDEKEKGKWGKQHPAYNRQVGPLFWLKLT